MTLNPLNHWKPWDGLIMVQTPTYNTGESIVLISTFTLYMPISFLINMSNTKKKKMEVYRYKDDVYDRLWEPAPPNGWTPQVSIHSNDDPIQNDYKTPAIVMRTAATPVNGNASFVFLWYQAAIGNDKYYVCMHFYEVEKLAANETREFNITLNGEHWYGPLRPPYRTTTTVFRPLALTGAVAYVFSLDRTEASTVPPIINAAEVYRARDLSQSETLQDDGTPFYLNMSL